MAFWVAFQPTPRPCFSVSFPSSFLRLTSSFFLLSLFFPYSFSLSYRGAKTWMDGWMDGFGLVCSLLLFVFSFSDLVVSRSRSFFACLAWLGLVWLAGLWLAQLGLGGLDGSEVDTALINRSIDLVPAG